VNPQDVLKRVCGALDLLIEAGEPHQGLFPSVLDPDTGAMLAELPPAIPGQRMGDRAFPGSNLIHDEATLATMYALAAALGRPDYAQAADRYLKRFATHCTDTASGLFPWGEHAFWHLAEDRVGNSYIDVADPSRPAGDAIHDHLRQAPLWLWEKLWQFNPRCVERFGEGLNGHYIPGEPLEYIRHAPITRVGSVRRGDRSCDFPRHSGFYIFDWTCAWLKTGRPDFIEQIRKIMDYWWDKRLESGLLLTESRGPVGDPRYPDYHLTISPSQTMGLTTSLWEAAPLLEPGQPALAAEMRRRAACYTDGFLSAPHDLARGIFVMHYNLDDGQGMMHSNVWGSIYGGWPASYMGLFACCSYRHSGDERLLRWALAVGEQYAAQPLPAGLPAPAMDAGMALGLLADLYDLTGEPRWLAAGAKLADAILDAYFQRRLPSGAAGIGWYEGQMGPSFVLHGLARLALLAEDRAACPLRADYTGR